MGTPWTFIINFVHSGNYKWSRSGNAVERKGQTTSEYLKAHSPFTYNITMKKFTDVPKLLTSADGVTLSQNPVLKASHDWAQISCRYDYRPLEGYRIQSSTENTSITVLASQNNQEQGDANKVLLTNDDVLIKRVDYAGALGATMNQSIFARICMGQFMKHWILVLRLLKRVIRIIWGAHEKTQHCPKPCGRDLRNTKKALWFLDRKSVV